MLRGKKKERDSFSTEGGGGTADRGEERAVEAGDGHLTKVSGEE